MATYKQLTAKIQSLQMLADEALLCEKVAAFEKIKALIIKHRLLPSDLGFSVDDESHSIKTQPRKSKK